MYVSNPPTVATATPPPTDPIAVARGLIAAAVARGAAMPDMVALDLAAAWDDLDDPSGPPGMVPVDDSVQIAPTELLLRARIALRQAIHTISPARRALQLASAIRHLDSALATGDGWTDGG
jgi:hypothetical protein